MSVADLFTKYSLFDKDSQRMIPWTDQHKNNLKNLMVTYKNGGQLAEILTCLQSCIQVNIQILTHNHLLSF